VELEPEPGFVVSVMALNGANCIDNERAAGDAPFE
jgi:hypothetical protein